MLEENEVWLDGPYEGPVWEAPATETVKFKVLQPFTWQGKKMEKGSEQEWPEEEAEALFFALGLRTDRINFVQVVETDN